MAAVRALVHLDDAVHDGDVAPVKVEHDHLARARGRAAEVEEEDVAAVEAGLHAAAEDDDDLGGGRGRAGEAAFVC